MNIESTAWATAVSVAAFALPFILLIGTFAVLAFFALRLDPERRSYVILVLDRLVLLAATFRRPRR